MSILNYPSSSFTHQTQPTPHISFFPPLTHKTQPSPPLFTHQTKPTPHIPMLPPFHSPNPTHASLPPFLSPNPIHTSYTHASPFHSPNRAHASPSFDFTVYSSSNRIRRLGTLSEPLFLDKILIRSVGPSGRPFVQSEPDQTQNGLWKCLYSAQFNPRLTYLAAVHVTPL